MTTYYTRAHRGDCTHACYPKFNPNNYSYVVCRGGAAIKHHTGPHAQELARIHASNLALWAEYRNESCEVRVEEYYRAGFHEGYRRTDTRPEVIRAGR